MTNSNLIMVVEDESLLLRAIDKKLEKSGLNSIPCESGAQAIEYLKSGGVIPDAIWLDYHLEDMNGLEFLKILKENSVWDNIPVIVVSNSATPDKVNAMLALGANKYMLKAEHRLDSLVEVIKEYIQGAK